MHARTRIAALAAALLLVGGALAQETATVGREVPDTKIKLKSRDKEEERYLFRELRGSIAFFYFWRSTNTASVELLSEIKDLYRQYGDKGVRFLSVTIDNKEKVEEVFEEEEVDFFRDWFVEGALLHYMLGALSEPYVVLVDPRGILAWRGVPDNRLKQRLADLHARTNPPAGDKEWLGRRYRQAERFFDQGEYGRAYTIARHLVELTEEGDTEHGRAQALQFKCETAADDWLKEAIQAERDKDYEKAARIVAEIAVRFEDPTEEDEDRQQHSGRDQDEESVNRKAEREIGRMNGNRELKKLIRDARLEAEARLRNDRAAGLEDDGYYVEAKRIYEDVVKEYEDTDAAEEAQRRIKRIETDKAIQRKIAERRARDESVRWLDLGDRFAAIEMYDEAREHYERVVGEHPDVPEAQRARERLAELPKAVGEGAARADSAGAGQPDRP
jgi:tetratricopeptide (TPR) repeat protein